MKKSFLEIEDFWKPGDLIVCVDSSNCLDILIGDIYRVEKCYRYVESKFVSISINNKSRSYYCNRFESVKEQRLKKLNKINEKNKYLRNSN